MGELRARFGPKSLHQAGCRGKQRCGGSFTCAGCSRLVGFCFGGSDELAPDHCDDCWRDRMATLVRVRDGYNTRYMVGHRVRMAPWKRAPIAVAEELNEGGFLEFKRNGRFYLTELGRRAIGDEGHL